MALPSGPFRPGNTGARKFSLAGSAGTTSGDTQDDRRHVVSPGPVRLSGSGSVYRGMVFSLTEARLSRDATNAEVRSGAGGSGADLGVLFERHAPAMYRTILAYTGGRVTSPKRRSGRRSRGRRLMLQSCEIHWRGYIGWRSMSRTTNSAGNAATVSPSETRCSSHRS